MRFIIIIAVIVIAAVAAWHYGLVPEGLVPGMDGGADGMPGGAERAPEAGLWRLGPDGKPAPAN